MVTKKDFKAIAEIIYNSFGDDICYHEPSLCVEKLADYFETRNPRFDREQFLAACGLLIS